MPLVTPTTVDALPDAPDPNDRTTFNTLAYPWSVALDPFTDQMNQLAEDTHTNATEASTQATSALSSATTATSAANTALAASNFKGEWSSLTGALNKPASVKNDSRFWLLLNNLADVTTSEPGVSADWTALDAGTDVTQIITSTTTASTGVTYLINADSIELDLPTSGILKGDFVGVVLLATPGTQTIDTGGTKVNKLTMDANKILLDKPSASFRLVYEDATVGFWIK